MFNLPGDELFDGFIDFSDQLVYQLTIYLSRLPSRSALPWSMLGLIMATLGPDVRYPHEPSDRKGWEEGTYINRIQFLLLGRFHLEPSLLSSFDHISRLVYQHHSLT